MLTPKSNSTTMSSSSPRRGRGRDAMSRPGLLQTVKQSFKKKRSPGDEEERRNSEAALHAGDPILPPPPRTNPLIWCCVIGCSILAVLVILAGFVVLIGYLAFHPQIPKFNVKEASLDTLLLDKDFLLSSDTKILVEAHNPNNKILLTYHYVKFELQFEKHTICTFMVEPFRQLPKNTTGFILDMNAVAVQMQVSEAEHISLAIQRNDKIYLDLQGTIKAKSQFGDITSIKYWMYTTCHLAFSPPPVGNGTLLSHDCRSRR